MTEMSEKMGTPTETLAHYGVLGMKWGKTRAKADPVQIRAARANVAAETKKLQAAARKTGQGTQAQRAAATQQYGDMKTAFLKNPDRVTAARLTRGEKAVAWALGLSGFGVPLTVAAIGGTSAQSRRIERKQELGKYDK